MYTGVLYIGSYCTLMWSC